MDENSPCLCKDARCTNKEIKSKYQKNGSDQVGISTKARYPKSPRNTLNEQRQRQANA